jgi:arylsulfatase
VLPIPQLEFKGKVGFRTSESVLDFPAEVTPPKGAPNILLIMPDDVGFGATAPFGGPVPTPALDRIANAGLRYNQFHTTALCSPTRAALLTRPQPPFRRHRRDHGARHRAPRLQLVDAEDCTPSL